MSIMYNIPCKSTDSILMLLEQNEDLLREKWAARLTSFAVLQQKSRGRMGLHTAVACSVAEIYSKSSQIMLNFSRVTENDLLHRKLDSHDTMIADELFRGNDVHSPTSSTLLHSAVLKSICYVLTHPDAHYGQTETVHKQWLANAAEQ